jgi:hypothetical protein
MDLKDGDSHKALRILFRILRLEDSSRMKVFRQAKNEDLRGEEEDGEE